MTGVWGEAADLRGDRTGTCSLTQASCWILASRCLAGTRKSSVYLSVPSQYVLSTTWNTWPNSVGAVPRKVGKGPLEYSAHSPLLAQAPWFGLRPHLTLGPAGGARGTAASLPLLESRWVWLKDSSGRSGGSAHSGPTREG